MESVAPALPEAAPPTLTVRHTLTIELIQLFTQEVREGLPFDGVCDYLGIRTHTFWKWKRLGEAYLSGDGTPEEHSIFGLFVQEIRKAAAEYRKTRLQSLHTPRNKNWFRDIVILERRDRKSFSKHDPLGGTDEDVDFDERFL